MAAQIIGTELQGWASVLAQQAMQHALGQELRQQQGYGQQATSMQFQQLPRQGAEQANKEMQQGSADRQANYQSMYNYPGASAADKAAIDTEGKSRADLASVGDWQTARSLDLSKLGGNLHRIYSRASGQASIFPYKMNRAQHSQDTLSAVGQAISSLGGGAANIGQSLQSNPTTLTPQQQSAFQQGAGPVSQQGAVSYLGGQANAWQSPYANGGQSVQLTSLY